VATNAPVQFYEDFANGASGLVAVPADGSAERGARWTTLIVGAGPPVVGEVADAAGGVMSLALTADNQAQDAMISFNDQLTFNIANGGVLEFRAALSVLPTTGVAVVAGACGPHNLDKDTTAVNAWFRWQASATLLTESDDTTNNNDDTANIYKIDFNVLASVKFYVNGARVSAATTFDMSNLTAAESVIQPYFSLDKASGTGVGTLLIDYVKFWGKR
jgi:hypothetical protein